MKKNRIIVCVMAIFMAVSFAFNTAAMPEEPADEELVKKGEACLEKKEYKEAMKYFTQAAEHGDAKAEAGIGILYCNGWGVEKNYKEAFKWFCKSAEHGDAQSQLGLFLLYYSPEEETEESIESFVVKNEKQLETLLQDIPHLFAIYYIDLISDVDDIGINNDGKSFLLMRKWLRKTEDGRENKKEALKWLRKAAEQGNDEAQLMLAEAYLIGGDSPLLPRLLEKDENEAAKWFRRAADQGEKDAKKQLEVLLAKGITGKDSEEDVERYRKLAEQGDADAQNKLGFCYYEGEGVEKDYKEAVKWWTKAAEQGLAKAQNNLGEMYLYGEGVEKDLDMARKWFRKAADQGHTEAKRHLERLKD